MPQTKRDPQITLKTGPADSSPRDRARWEIRREIKRLGREPGFLEGDKLEVAVVKGHWMLTHLPAGPRPEPAPVEHYFPTEEDAVTSE